MLVSNYNYKWFNSIQFTDEKKMSSYLFKTEADKAVFVETGQLFTLMTSVYSMNQFWGIPLSKL